MSHPSIHAKSHPDKPAIVMAGSGEIITFSELDRRSNSIAHLFRSRGFQIDDTVAMCMDNCAGFFDVIWGAQRAGLRLVSISTRLTAPEMDYILEDSGAKMLIASASLGDTLDHLSGASEYQRYITGGNRDGWASLSDALADMPDTPIADERCGVSML